ncbi:prolyl oligopeptidase family serine peptidase [Mucilaginibacter gossypii]|uniref:prolyl oligopeptidase family serine peptidase n=1 Tax=Mucilaginibacter gossypii TaxID=551996 RepID=UPI000DCC19C0|nr:MULTISPECIES: prolyl oligopeptidase family serine peptidase [Mucilaginibacter]QTE35497.1 prolyl oligopeptidase family serine peptidase [Mucilaginibacter gossypii]RAV59313.1 S9 family peptidase [Mucilaginibacter rubeus]
MKKLLGLLFLIPATGAFAQKLDTLSIEKIMRAPKWIGVSPSNINWANDSKKIYFKWDDDASGDTRLYSVSPGDNKVQKVSIAEQRDLAAGYGEWNKKHSQKVFSKNGDLFLYDVKANKTTRLTNTVAQEDSPVFSGDETKIIYKEDNNLFALNLNGGTLVQLTNFVRTASDKKSKDKPGEQEQWLKKQQLELFEIIKKEAKEDKKDSTETALLKPDKLKEIAYGDKRLSAVQISPDGRFITYRLTKRTDGVQNAIVPNYVTASGFTEDIPNRSKVGRPSSTSETFIYDKRREAVYPVITSEIPGIKDLPDYLKDYPDELKARQKENADRQVNIDGVLWNQSGSNAVVIISAQDNKDCWIMRLDPVSGKLSLLDRQRDEAWIGGPGIDDPGNTGFIDDNHFYYQSEASGYSHIYVVDVTSGAKKQLTSGKWEVQTLQLSQNKKTFYFTANIDHPGITHFYSIPVSGGTPVKITGMKGGNEVTLSPDEKWLAIRYSYSNRPWELYIQANKPGAKAVKITNSVSAEYLSYSWRDPEIISFKNRYGTDVYARLYQPKKQDPAKPAVVFVHGAGYLQNVTYSWSYYFREFMFNNMLADNGYTVLDIDYTASAGYGRDFRTGIYRHMGGKDLTDQVDGVKLLVEKYGVNPKHVGLYGGSYGGFITLMGMFTEPNVFAAGGAIRSVTDWAHYNHEYTSNILNEPFTDEQAYRKSSPIYFANGLKGNLLMLHGMIDQNVNYQDIIRLTQKLIELHKENWELASYPVEDHGFEQPSSWADEYKRIYKLFERTLKK